MFSEKNTVFVGKKDMMAYVLAVSIQAAKNKEVRLKARGKSISIAVDISQIVLDKYLKGWSISSINVGTETFEKTVRNSNRVSFIQIDMAKGNV